MSKFSLQKFDRKKNMIILKIRKKVLYMIIVWHTTSILTLFYSIVVSYSIGVYKLLHKNKNKSHYLFFYCSAKVCLFLFIVFNSIYSIVKNWYMPFVHISACVRLIALDYIEFVLVMSAISHICFLLPFSFQ